MAKKRIGSSKERSMLFARILNKVWVCQYRDDMDKDARRTIRGNRRYYTAKYLASLSIKELKLRAAGQV